MMMDGELGTLVHEAKEPGDDRDCRQAPQGSGATALINAHIVSANREGMGSVCVADGFITSVDDQSRPNAADTVDFDGDYLIPGLIDLHTDSMEAHFAPRPGVEWPSPLAALLTHDANILAAGITTVFDALAVGDYGSNGVRPRILKLALEANAQARRHRLLRVEHFFHFRCEASDPLLMEVANRHLDDEHLKLISVMDHTPGQRQWRDLAYYRKYQREKKGRAWDDSAFDRHIAERREQQGQFVKKHRQFISQAAKSRHILLASHDDTTAQDVDQSAHEGVAISEFPTTLEAAQLAHENGMKTIMGSPNVVLGRSHSGNVSASELADHGCLDILTSDYVPTSLLHAPFVLAERGMPLSQALAMVTATPADTLNLSDRGHIKVGKRADILRVRLIDGVPVIRGIWVQGKRCF